MRRSVHPVTLIFLGLFSTPIVVAWIIDRERRQAEEPRGSFRLFPWVTLVSLGIYLALIVFPLDWKIASLVWGMYVLIASPALALTSYIRNLSNEKAEPSPGWAKRSFAAFPVIFLPALAADLLCMNLVNTLLNRFLLRFPIASTSSESIGWMFINPLWSVIWCAVFVCISLRRGFLRNDIEMGIAMAAWLYVLILKTVLADRLLKVMGSLAAGIQTDVAFSDWIRVLLIVAFSIALPFLGAYLAWAEGKVLRKYAGVTGLCLLAACSGCMLLGVISWTECAIGKSIERSGEPQKALKWYGRSLIRRSNPELVSYLQYRIGLLNYKAGSDDRAVESFKMIQTIHNANESLVLSAGHHMDRLLEYSTGDRFVLPGVETKTEFLPSYCAPNTLALVFKFWNVDHRAVKIGSDIALFSQGSQMADMVSYCNKTGFRHILVPFTQDSDVRTLLSSGIPVVAYLPGHVLAIFGYDDRLNTYIVYDTASWDIWEDHPIDDFLMLWSQTNYTGAIIVPYHANPEIEIVCERYSTPAGRALWMTVLADTETDPWVKLEYQKAAVEADPTFLPGLLSLAQKIPMYGNAFSGFSLEQSMSHIRDLYHREHFDNWAYILEFAVFLLQHGDFDAIIELARDVKSLNIETLVDDGEDTLQDIQNLAGVVLWMRGDFAAAERLIDESSTSFAGLGALALGISQTNLSFHEKAIQSFSNATRFGTGDICQKAISCMDEIDWETDPSAFEENYGNYLNRWPLDVHRQIRFAELCLDMESRGGKGQENRMYLARRALTIARALAEGNAVHLAKIEQLQQKLSEK